MELVPLQVLTQPGCWAILSVIQSRSGPQQAGTPPWRAMLSEHCESVTWYLPQCFSVCGRDVPELRGSCQNPCSTPHGTGWCCQSFGEELLVFLVLNLSATDTHDLCDLHSSGTACKLLRSTPHRDTPPARLSATCNVSAHQANQSQNLCADSENLRTSALESSWIHRTELADARGSLSLSGCRPSRIGRDIRHSWGTQLSQHCSRTRHSNTHPLMYLLSLQFHSLAIGKDFCLGRVSELAWST